VEIRLSDHRHALSGHGESVSRSPAILTVAHIEGVAVVMAGEPLRICIDARVDPATWGGVSSVLMGLAHGLSSLDDGDEKYAFLVSAQGAPWLEPYADPDKFLTVTAGRVKSARAAASKASIPRWMPGAAWASRTASRVRPADWPPIPKSDGTAESAGVDLIHFVAQNAFLTDVPSIYHPHDLQHVHLPDFFTSWRRRRRDLEYGTFCRQAAMVAVTSEWGRRDVIDHFGLPEDKVAVVPWAPPTLAYEAPDESALNSASKRLELPRRFLFYPAHAWPHKNHLALFRALARLRDEEGLTVSLVCTGGDHAYAAELLNQRRALGLDEQVRWLGYVSPADLRALFELCESVVVPTLFEAASGPVWEAFVAGAPVACSNVTSLPAQAGDAAIVFDPHDEAALVAAVRRLWLDDELRRDLGRKGRERVGTFTWERTAKHFRAHYRRIAGRELDATDRALLEAPPLL
jgi:glycosyltransferase involved in cell wall biosynthesis